MPPNQPVPTKSDNLAQELVTKAFTAHTNKFSKDSKTHFLPPQVQKLRDFLDTWERTVLLPTVETEATLRLSEIEQAFEAYKKQKVDEIEHLKQRILEIEREAAAKLLRTANDIIAEHNKTVAGLIVQVRFESGGGKDGEDWASLKLPELSGVTKPLKFKAMVAGVAQGVAHGGSSAGVSQGGSQGGTQAGSQGGFSGYAGSYMGSSLR